VSDAIYRALEMLPFVALLAACGAPLWLAHSSKPRRGVFLGVGLAVLAAGVLRRRHPLDAGATPGGAGVLIAGASTIFLGLFAGRLRFGQIAVLGLTVWCPSSLRCSTRTISPTTGPARRSSFPATFAALRRSAQEEPQIQPPRIYLVRSVLFLWRVVRQFYLIKHGRLDLLDRTINAYLFYPERVLQLPPRSLIVTNAGDGPTDIIIDGLVAAGQLTRKAVITEPDGTPTYLVLQRGD
jgi:hypothetical protein